mgnify:CR=1 FL=1
MHAGIDPFSDDDAMGIYKNILKGKYKEKSPRRLMLEPISMLEF